MEKSKATWIKLLIVLLAMFAMTAILLLVGAVIVYYMELSAQTAHMLIIGIYILVGLFGDFLIGKIMKMRKFMWGIGAGLMYFACLLMISLIMHGGTINDTIQMLITFVLVTASAMIGGMIS